MWCDINSYRLNLYIYEENILFFAIFLKKFLYEQKESNHPYIKLSIHMSNCLYILNWIEYWIKIKFFCIIFIKKFGCYFQNVEKIKYQIYVLLINKLLYKILI